MGFNKIRTGQYKVGELSFEALAPEGSGPFPVLIMLHGGGGDGASKMRYAAPRLTKAGLLKTHIVVAPDGENNRWNAIAEPTTRADSRLISQTLTEYLETFSNVKPIFQLHGHSNGASLVNRILVESDNPKITTGITSGSQLAVDFWHDGSFYIGGDDNAYNTPKARLTKRRILQHVGALDHVIPPNGGPSRIPGKSGPLKFLSWEESIYRLAKGCGYAGPMVRAEHTGTRAQVSYLGGKVQSSLLKEEGHNPFPVDEVVAFLQADPAI